MQELVTVKISGLKEIQERLESIPKKIARRFLRTGLRLAASLWADEMRARAPRLEDVKLSTNPKYVRVPGDLARHIGIKVKVNSDLEGSVAVGPLKRVFWSLFLEFGTRFMSAKPFIRPAFEAKKQAVLDRLIQEGKKILERPNDV